MTAKKKAVAARVTPPNKRQVSFYADVEVFEKIEAVAYKEAVNNSELINLALLKFVELYEEKNGKIQLPRNKGEGLKNL